MSACRALLSAVILLLPALPALAADPESGSGLDPTSTGYRAVTSPAVATEEALPSDMPDVEAEDKTSEKAGPKETRQTAKDDKKNDKKAKKKDKEQYHFLPPITWGGPEGKDYKLQIGGDTRIRGESRRNYDGVLGTADDDDLMVVRTRVSADLLYRDVVRAFVQVLDGRVWFNDHEYRQDTHLNLQQLFLELRNPEVTPWSVRLGRQEMEYGRNKRLVEETNWNNLRRTYDGVRAMYRTEEVDVDLFYVNTTSFDRRRGLRRITERARTREDEYFYGAYATLRQWDPHTIETYFLGLNDTDGQRTRSERGRRGTSDRYTIGTAIYGPLWKQEECGTLGYGLEGAYQFGRRSEDTIRAYMLHGDIWYEWEHPWKPKLSLVANLASGDDGSGDGKAGTFNPLFGSSHSPYGIIDFVRLQNLRELALVGNVKPTDKMKLQLEYHTYWLDSKSDAWYDAGGRARGTPPHGGSRIGQEISAVLSYKWSECLTTEAGAAHFFSGPAAENAGQGSGANLLYAQTVISF